MDVLSFRDYCLSLPLTEETTPFDETTLVYKIGGKMYACADKIAEIDRQMQDMYRRIKAAEKESAAADT